MTLSRILIASVLWAAVAAAQNAPRPGARVPSAAKSGPKQAVATTAQRKTKMISAAQRRRDPFVSIIQTRSAESSHCAGTGKKCLVIHQIVLKGIAQSPDGMLALVENGQRKSYLLREKDPVFNGEVLRITRDSVTFRQRAVDKLGRVVTHDVVMKIALGKPA